MKDDDEEEHDDDDETNETLNIRPKGPPLRIFELSRQP
jgi:hypothetical protein